MSDPIIETYNDLFDAVGIGIYDDFDRTWMALSKAIFKGTRCGAWVAQWADDADKPKGVVVGSIVEGADECPPAIRTEFPFKISEFWNALEQIEDQCDVIWNDTHGCEDCWPDGYTNGIEELEFGCWPINPDCEECSGEGVVL